jgi:hypothetical protein
MRELSKQIFINRPENLKRVAMCHKCHKRPQCPNQRTRRRVTGVSEMGQRTKSLRDSPLRGGKSREAVASREDTNSGWGAPS